MRRHLAVLVGVVLIAGSGVVLAAGRGERPRRGPDPQLLKQELGLSEDQWGRAHKIWSEGARERIRRQAAVRLARLDLRELMQVSTPDEKAIGAKVKELTDLQAAAVKGRIDQALALKKVLTPEQQEKMMQLRRHHARPGAGPRGQGPRRGALGTDDLDDGDGPGSWGDDEQ